MAIFSPTNTSELIQAIVTANSNGKADVIELTKGTYTLDTVHNTIDGPNGLPNIITPIEIRGNGATLKRLSTAEEFRIFHVASTGKLTLWDLNIQNGYAKGGPGGGIYNKGVLTLHNCGVLENHSDLDGGGIYNQGKLAVKDSRLEDNSASLHGGAIYNGQEVGWPFGPDLNHLAAFSADGSLYTTNNFMMPASEGGPTWTTSDLNIAGTPLQFVAHAFSPKYLGTGKIVNGWLVTSTHIYYIHDVANVSGTRTVTNQHTFAEASNYRTIQTERGVANWVVVASHYNGVGVKACYTTNGGLTWTEGLVGGNRVLNWTDTISKTQYPTDQDGSFTVQIDGNLLTVHWTRPNINGAWYDQCGLQVATTCSQPLSSILYRVKRYETAAPQCGSSWNVVNNTYQNLAHLLNPLGHDWSFVADQGSEDQEWNTFLWSAPDDIPVDVTYFKSLDQGFRGAPDLSYVPPTPCTNTVYFEILEVNGEPNSNDAADLRPQVHVSGKVPGLCYITAFYGATGALYKSTDYGATWTHVSIPANNFGGYLGGGILFPWQGNNPENMVYWGKLVDGDLYVYRTGTNGTTMTNITPSGNYGPDEPCCWSSCPRDRLLLALMGTNKSTGEIAVFTSSDGGDTWDQITEAVARDEAYTAVSITDDPDVMLFWGPAGVALSEDGGISIDGRLGNLSAVDEIISLCAI